jgi:hypothetical protein
MKKFSKMAAQGELLFVRVDKIPKEATRATEELNGKIIVGHSETGHHHVVDASKAKMFDTKDPLLSYLDVNSDVSVVHEREFDTHEPLRLISGIYEVRRQRESSPEGWKTVQD